MRIQAKDLRVHLKQGMSSFYFVFGEEPIQLQETLHLLRHAAKKAGYAEREIFEANASSNFEALMENFQSLNLFASKRFIECRFTESKIGKMTGEAFTQLADMASKNSILFFLIAPKLDTKIQQSAWFNTLEQKGCTIHARQLSKEETLAWLERRLVANGFKPAPGTISLLFERTEGNLLASAQAIEKIRLYGAPTELKPADIAAIISAESRFTVFDLVDSALVGESERTAQIFFSLKDEGVDPTLLVWAAAREIRTVILLSSKVKGAHIPPNTLNELGIWKRREPLIKALRDRFSVPKLQQILIKIKAIDDILKGRTIGHPWSDLLSKYCEPA